MNGSTFGSSVFPAIGGDLLKDRRLGAIFNGGDNKPTFFGKIVPALRAIWLMNGTNYSSSVYFRKPWRRPGTSEITDRQRPGVGRLPSGI